MTIYIASKDDEVLGIGIYVDSLITQMELYDDYNISTWDSDNGSIDLTEIIENTNLTPYCGIFYVYDDKTDTDYWEIYEYGKLIDVRYG